MDSLTHLIAGAATPLAFPHAPKRTALVLFGIFAGELPDYDIFFGTSPDSLFTLHRGITHALLWQPVLALALSLLFFLWLWRPVCLGTAQSQKVVHLGDYSLWKLFLAALAALLLHLYLDCMTTFGTRIALPFSSARVALPAMFIIDLILTIPAGVLLVMALCQKGVPSPTLPILSQVRGIDPTGGLVYSPRARALARFALGWLLLYPGLCLAINQGTTLWLSSRMNLPVNSQLHLLTEPFSPFVWKKLVEEPDGWRMSTLFLFSPTAPKEVLTLPRPAPALIEEFQHQLPLFKQYTDFAPLLTCTSTRIARQGQTGADTPLTEYIFADVRYVISAQSPARFFGRKDTNFLFAIRTNSSGKIVQWRFMRSEKSTDTPWYTL